MIRFHKPRSRRQLWSLCHWLTSCSGAKTGLRGNIMSETSSTVCDAYRLFEFKHWWINTADRGSLTIFANLLGRDIKQMIIVEGLLLNGRCHCEGFSSSVSFQPPNNILSSVQPWVRFFEMQFGTRPLKVWLGQVKRPDVTSNPLALPPSVSPRNPQSSLGFSGYKPSFVCPPQHRAQPWCHGYLKEGV